MTVWVKEERKSEGRFVTERIPVASRKGLDYRMRKQADFSLVFPYVKT